MRKRERRVDPERDTACATHTQANVLGYMRFQRPEFQCMWGTTMDLKLVALVRTRRHGETAPMAAKASEETRRSE